MSQVINILYGVVLFALSPFLLIRHFIASKHITELRAKVFGSNPSLDRSRRVVWFHGVSLGEVQLLATVIAAFRRRFPDWQCVVSATTETGLAEARRRFPDLTVIAWPFDFTWAVRRTLDHVAPDLIVLAEGEVWPNFLREANRRQVPVVVINARMSPRSLRRYQRVRWLAKSVLFDRITYWAVQSEQYARNFQELGIPPDRLTVTGSVKYDGALADRDHPRVRELRGLFNFAAIDRVWVAGSTHPPEEKIILDAFRRLRVRFPNLRLILVPRRPERFDEVAALLDRGNYSFVRRSELSEPLRDRPAVILLDTIGELSAAWGLADIAFVGGSLDGKRGGQNMIDPAGYGTAVIFGPNVWNFREPAAQLVEADGAVQIATPASLESTVRKLLEDPIGRERMGGAARKLVQDQQGATQKTLDVIGQIIGAEQTKTRRAG